MTETFVQYDVSNTVLSGSQSVSSWNSFWRHAISFQRPAVCSALTLPLCSVFRSRTGESLGLKSRTNTFIFVAILLSTWKILLARPVVLCTSASDYVRRKQVSLSMDWWYRQVSVRCEQRWMRRQRGGGRPSDRDGTDPWGLSVVELSEPHVYGAVRWSTEDHTGICTLLHLITVQAAAQLQTFSLHYRYGCDWRLTNDLSYDSSCCLNWLFTFFSAIVISRLQSAAPLVANNLQSGRFWAKLAASVHDSLWASRSFYTVFMQDICGRPSSLIQSTESKEVKCLCLCLAMMLIMQWSSVWKLYLCVLYNSEEIVNNSWIYIAYKEKCDTSNALYVLVLWKQLVLTFITGQVMFLPGFLQQNCHPGRTLF